MSITASQPRIGAIDDTLLRKIAGYGNRLRSGHLLTDAESELLILTHTEICHELLAVREALAAIHAAGDPATSRRIADASNVVHLNAPLDI